MMTILIDIANILSWICLVVGAIFCVIGGIGMIRLPNFYSRTHAATITDTLGAGLMLSGLMLQGLVAAQPLIVVKLALILAIIFLLNPAASHALAKAAYAWGVRSNAPEYTERDGDDDPH